MLSPYHNTRKDLLLEVPPLVKISELPIAEAASGVWELS